LDDINAWMIARIPSLTEIHNQEAQ
jgi:hypothetical protein